MPPYQVGAPKVWHCHLHHGHSLFSTQVHVFNCLDVAHRKLSKWNTRDLSAMQSIFVFSLVNGVFAFVCILQQVFLTELLVLMKLPLLGDCCLFWLLTVFYLFFVSLFVFFWDRISLISTILCRWGRPPDGIPRISVSQRKKSENRFKQILILQFYCPVNARLRVLRLWGVTLYSSVNQMYHKGFLTVSFPRLKPGCAG